MTPEQVFKSETRPTQEDAALAAFKVSMKLKARQGKKLTATVLAAVTYLDGYDLAIQEYGTEGEHVQLVYALGNIGFIRGWDDEDRAAIGVLKAREKLLKGGKR